MVSVSLVHGIKNEHTLNNNDEEILRQLKIIIVQQTIFSYFTS